MSLQDSKPAPANHTKANVTPSLRKAAAAAPKVNGTLANSTKANLLKEQKVLTDLFAKLKTNIKGFNKYEQESKDSNKVRIQEIQKKLERDRAELNKTKNGTFQHEELVNRTRDEERDLKYWTEGRELQHQMFHSHLKMTHSMMERVRSVLDAYQQVLTKGKLDPKVKQALHATAESLPKSFIQMRRELKLSKALLERR
eukprot:gnl/TRDRNA2_/TRDRNA2_88733_c0_seq1.p1 gnl/TRDRNA2_/TRDRNA2_88733_c0~~gnl/TRDRNA2_/TRDRNA2_88733_c0_seq1.p1  ORF type:complete len:232 (+),score=75.40 gnl/TRDRNA2_/TRDRNA2_88733_c0_seq1:102-698(+)